MHILSVNIGRAVPRLIQNQSVLTAIGKAPVDQAVAFGPMGLDGDEQADLSVHGGLSKAIYAYPSEHFAFWSTVRAQAKVAPWQEPIPPGMMGENLTLQGLLETQLWIGDRLVLSDGGVLVVSEPRFPCFKFNAVMGFNQAAKLMTESGYCGVYLAVLQPGQLRAGQGFELEPGPRELSLPDAFRSRAHRR